MSKIRDAYGQTGVNDTKPIRDLELFEEQVILIITPQAVDEDSANADCGWASTAPPVCINFASQVSPT